MDENRSRLIERIQQGDRDAQGELFALVERCVRPVAVRRLGRVDADDSVHDVFLIVLNALRTDKLRDPERLCAYIGAIFRFRRWRKWQTESAAVERPVESLELRCARKTPELLLHESENLRLLRQTLSSCSERDRNILRRYVDGQEREQICKEMDLTPTQYRLLKSRAKDRFVKIGRRLLEAPAPPPPAKRYQIGA